MQGPADKIEEAKPGLRAIVEEPANGVLHSSCVFRAIRLMCDIYIFSYYVQIGFVMSCNQIAGRSLHWSHQIWFFERFFIGFEVCGCSGPLVTCDKPCHFDVATV